MVEPVPLILITWRPPKPLSVVSAIGVVLALSLIMSMFSNFSFSIVTPLAKPIPPVASNMALPSRDRPVTKVMDLLKTISLLILYLYPPCTITVKSSMAEKRSIFVFSTSSSIDSARMSIHLPSPYFSLKFSDSLVLISTFP